MKQASTKLTRQETGETENSGNHFLLFIFLFCACVSIANGQKIRESTLFKTAFILPSESNKFPYVSNNRNEIQSIFSGMFLFYKSFISSQDVPDVCSFKPSCSEYGLLSVKKNGPIIGIMSTFDRLTRCNGQNVDKYRLDENTRKLIDEP